MQALCVLHKIQRLSLYKAETLYLECSKTMKHGTTTSYTTSKKL